MKFRFLLPGLILFALLVLSLGNAAAQGSRTPPKKAKKVSPVGFGMNLGNIRFGNSTFDMGFTPNVAVRLSNNFALGAMLRLDYRYYKYRPSNLRFSAFDIGPAVFARWKPLWNAETVTPFLQGLFIQAEYERAFIAYERTDDFGNVIINGNRIEAQRFGEDYLYVGLGASAGYPLSTFISLHYNVIDRYNLTRIPFDYRFGITYNY